MERNKIYVVYKITNILNNMQYVGVHGTYDINDNYMGSGNHLKLAIALYGEENFAKEFLHTFETKEEALQKEREIVNEEFLQRDDVYNIKLGGEGGWEHCRENCQTPEALNKRSESAKRAVAEGRLKTLTPESRRKGQLAKGMLGKKHTPESKKKISENNGAKLDQITFDSRVLDYQNIEKKRGYISELADKWGISHTQVKRFLNKII